MSDMKCLILILFSLLVMAALASSQMPVRLNGSAGLTLLNSLTEGPLNLTNDSLNSTSNSTNLNRFLDTSSDFRSWGTGPKNYPLFVSGTGTDYLNDTSI
jgi:hypothetical protein